MDIHFCQISQATRNAELFLETWERPPFETIKEQVQSSDTAEQLRTISLALSHKWSEVREQAKLLKKTLATAREASQTLWDSIEAGCKLNHEVSKLEIDVHFEDLLSGVGVPGLEIDYFQKRMNIPFKMWMELDAESHRKWRAELEKAEQLLP